MEEKFKETRKKILEIVNGNRTPEVKEYYEYFTDDMAKIKEQYWNEIKELDGLGFPTDELKNKLLAEQVACCNFHLGEIKEASLRSPQLPKRIIWKDFEHIRYGTRTYGIKAAVIDFYEQGLVKLQQDTVKFAQELWDEEWENRCNEIREAAAKQLEKYYEIKARYVNEDEEEDGEQ